MSVFRELERRIDEQLRKLFAGAEPADQRRELIEIQRAILDDVADHAQTLPRARRVLPFNDLRIRIPVPEPDRRTAFQLVFVEGDQLGREIREHLRREEIEFPADIRVAVDLLSENVPDFAGKGFHVAYGTREAEAATVTLAMAATVRFTPAAGEAIEVAKPRIHVGRTAEVLDDRKRLVRRNDVVLDHDTVSRAHAHIEFDPKRRAFHLFDDGSTYGTGVIHSGRLCDVPASGARGQRLDSGDEIYFGQARVKFEIL
jgi:hypothetical protein